MTKMRIDESFKPSGITYDLTIEMEWQKIVINCRTIKGASDIQDTIAENAKGITVIKDRALPNAH